RLQRDRRCDRRGRRRDRGDPGDVGRAAQVQHRRPGDLGGPEQDDGEHARRGSSRGPGDRERARRRAPGAPARPRSRRDRRWPAGYEAETRALGAGVLGASFKDVKAKFYDIVIRSDVGNVDVAWSQKADTDDDLKRLNLSRQRELKQLRDEFKDILDEGTVKPS